MTDEDRVVIYANSNVSRGKFAAAAVHAALTAAGVHPGLPMIVLGAKPSAIEEHRTVIRDAGRTEVEPGTVTAGTDWAPASVPSDDVHAVIEEAQARLTTSRLGRSMWRETDKDLVVIKRLIDALESATAPPSVTDEMVKAAADRDERRAAAMALRDLGREIEGEADASDDEREALARVIFLSKYPDSEDTWDDATGWDKSLWWGMADPILAAGFRRAPIDVALPERLRAELRGWGFGQDGEHRVIHGGAHMVYVDDGSDYVLASSTYWGEAVSPARPFLATVLDVLRWAAGERHD